VTLRGGIATIVGRDVFDMTNGWDGKPPGEVDHVVVVTHRARPEGWHPEAPFYLGSERIGVVGAASR
jgi:hypothetical protein